VGVDLNVRFLVTYDSVRQLDNDTKGCFSREGVFSASRMSFARVLIANVDCGDWLAWLVVCPSSRLHRFTSAARVTVTWSWNCTNKRKTT
jgi:hypothetical protein